MTNTNTITTTAPNEAQLAYLTELITGSICLYAYDSKDRKTIENILAYYGYDDFDINFCRPFNYGNKCIRITIVGIENPGTPDWDFDERYIYIEY